MKQEYSIELLEEYENVNFYSIRMAGEELTEFIKNQGWHDGACG